MPINVFSFVYYIMMGVAFGLFWMPLFWKGKYEEGILYKYMPKNKKARAILLIIFAMFWPITNVVIIAYLFWKFFLIVIDMIKENL